MTVDPKAPTSGSKPAIPPKGTKVTTNTLVISPVFLVFANRGDVPIHDMVAVLSTNVSSLVGTALSATTYPLGILGQTIFHLFTLAPYSSQSVTLMVRSAANCSALEPLTVSSSYTNAIGLTQTQTNTVTLQVGSGICRQPSFGPEVELP
jgi:hypothetical protein